MSHDNSAKHRVLDVLVRVLTGARDRVQDRLWAGPEAAARAAGTEVTRSPRGWSLTVRDPRWNRRRRCGACAGDGATARGPCGVCGGTGVVVLSPVAGNGADGPGDRTPAGPGRREPAYLGRTG